MAKRHRKARYVVLGVASAALAVVVAWAWYDSTRGSRLVQYRRLAFHSGGGVFAFAWHPPRPATALTWQNDFYPNMVGPKPLIHWAPPPSAKFRHADPAVVVSPMVLYWWLFAPLIGLFGWSAWKCMRRYYPPGTCQSCGYDLTGNVSGVCPECAAAILPAAQATDIAT